MDVDEESKFDQVYADEDPLILQNLFCAANNGERFPDVQEILNKNRQQINHQNDFQDNLQDEQQYNHHQEEINILENHGNARGTIRQRSDEANDPNQRI